jgi:Protein of unknown function (DUF2961)
VATVVAYLVAILWCACAAAAMPEPPVIPVGLDAYRMWDRWAYQRIGARTYMRSTYDRRGGNEGADASHFLYQLADDRNVSLDLRSPGVLCFARYNHWHGSPWIYEVDGTEHIVQESSTADPTRPVPGSIFLPEKPFPNPLTWTWSLTKGADLTWVPIEFEKAFRLAYSRTHYGTGYYIYQQYVPGAKLSHRLHSWNESRLPDKDVLELIASSGSDLLPKPGSAAAERAGLRDLSGTLNPSEPIVLESGPSTIRMLQFTVARDQAYEFGRARLRVFWDESPHASIDAPVCLFFGAGTLYNRDNREYLVKAFPVNIRLSQETVQLTCFFPMPFFHSARIEVTPEAGPVAANWRIRHAPLRDGPTAVAYFHATYRDHPNPEPGRDLVLLDTRQTEGGGAWSGHLVGTSFIFSDRAVLNTLEGDPRFFFDDSHTPQAQGTGTEEWGGGGDYWGGQNMTLPFAGHPTGARSVKEAKSKEDQIESAYRFLLADLMPFGRNAVIRLEHGGQNDSSEHYQTVAFWYGIHMASLMKTAELKIGDSASEKAHHYFSPNASEPYLITSRYEWGVDTLNGKEVYPAHTDMARKTTGSSEFDLSLWPANFGVLLRRKLDYQFPNQCAEVFVAPLKNGKPAGSFRLAGVWYLAGSSTCVYSNPKEELGGAQHIMQTSNRRFRDDEFLIGRKFTQQQPAIRVRLRFRPVAIPLMPGEPLPKLAWTELGYTAYCFVEPGAGARSKSE